MKSLGPTRNRAYSWATKSQAPLYSSEVKVWTYQTTSANWPWCPVKRPSCSGNPCTRQEKQQKRRGCKSTRLRGQPVFQGWRCSVNFPKENIFSRDTADVVFFLSALVSSSSVSQNTLDPSLFLFLFCLGSFPWRQSRLEVGRDSQVRLRITS